MQRWKFFKCKKKKGEKNTKKPNTNKNVFKIWMCDILGMETIIKIF